MSKVKEFAAKVLAEIKAALEEQLPLRNISTLAKYQTENWFVGLLQMELQNRLGGELGNHLDDKEKSRLTDEAEAEVSEESLQVFIRMLEKQYKFIWETNCIYMSATHSAATRAAEVLARNLHEHIKSDKYHHHYDYMLPGDVPPTVKFTSSTGRFEDMPLNAFFMTSDGIPVEVLACLDGYRRAKNSVNPKHVCLREADWPNKVCPELTDEDRLRLTTHSQEAKDYDWAICHSNDEAEKDAYRQKLVDVLANKNFVPGYNYIESDKRLLANGALNDFNVRSLDEASKLLVRIHPEDWLGFVKCLDYDTVLSMLLPKTPSLGQMQGKPDSSIFIRANEARLKDFLNNPKWYVPCGEDMQLNIATFFLLAELFKRIRSRELVHTGAISQATGYATNKEQKLSALEFFQEFLLSCLLEGGRCLNQLEEYARDKGHSDDYAAWLQEGRTFLLVDKAKQLWESLIKQAALNTHQEDADLKNPGSFIYNKLTLIGDAHTLCKFSKLRWEEKVSELYDPSKGRMNALQSFVKSFLSPRSFLDNIYARQDDFANCVSRKDHYMQGEHLLNRAVLYIFANYYGFYRNLDNDNKSTGGKLMGAPDKKVKLAAVDAFKRFLRSDYELNELSKFIEVECPKEERVGLMKALNDLSYFSQLSALAAQAGKVYSPTFFVDDPAVDVAQASAAWAYVPAWFGGK